MSKISDLRNIIDCIRKIAGTDKLNGVKSDICRVDSVDETNGQISCTSIIGAAEIQYKEVMLNAEGNDGIIAIPAIGSNVVIIQLKNNQCFVVANSDIDKYICVIDGNNSFTFNASGFIWNGGLLGGLPTSPALVSKLNAIETQLNAIGVWALTVTPPLVLPPIPLTTQPQIENSKIKQ